MMNKREGIPFDGFGSVLEMLNGSDANFREKILNNLRRKDPELARRLENGLRHVYGNRDEEARVALERSQRHAFARSYGH